MNHAYSYTEPASNLLRYALTLAHKLRTPALRAMHIESDYWRALATVLVSHPESVMSGVVTQGILAEHQRQALGWYDNLNPSITRSGSNVGSNSLGYMEEYAADILKPSHFPLTNQITVIHLWWLTYYHSRLFFPDELQLPNHGIPTMHELLMVPADLRSTGLTSRSRQPAPQVAPIRHRRQLY